MFLVFFSDPFSSPAVFPPSASMSYSCRFSPSSVSYSSTSSSSMLSSISYRGSHSSTSSFSCNLSPSLIFYSFKFFSSLLSIFFLRFFPIPTHYLLHPFFLHLFSLFNFPLIHHLFFSPFFPIPPYLRLFLFLHLFFLFIFYSLKSSTSMLSSIVFLSGFHIPPLYLLRPFFPCIFSFLLISCP